VGFSVSLVYITIYYRYVTAKDKFSHLMMILGTAAFVVVVIVYSKVSQMNVTQSAASLTFALSSDAV
jgi:hypothetical protein